MKRVKIVDGIDFEIDLDLIDKDGLKQAYDLCNTAYIEGASYLFGLPAIIAKNDPTDEAEAKNIDDLNTTKENIIGNMKQLEDKMNFLNYIKNGGV